MIEIYFYSPRKSKAVVLPLTERDRLIAVDEIVGGDKIMYIIGFYLSSRLARKYDRHNRYV